MKALSLLQPWATLLAHGKKRFETRSWDTSFRGRFAIHASGKLSVATAAICYQEPFHTALKQCDIHLLRDLPHGAIIGVAEIVRTWKTSELRDSIGSIEWAFGDYGPRRYAFEVANPVLLPQPIPCKGQLDFWKVPVDVLAHIPECYWAESAGCAAPLFE